MSELLQQEHKHLDAHGGQVTCILSNMIVVCIAYVSKIAETHMRKLWIAEHLLGSQTGSFQTQYAPAVT